jgi:hypothetical protein
LQLNGASIALTVSNTELAVAGTVTTALVANNVTILVFTGTAALVIRNDGIAGRFGLSATGNIPGSLNFTLAGTFMFEVNTTRTTVSSIAGVPLITVLPDRLNLSDATANAWARVAVTGNMGVLGVTVNGGFEIAVSSAVELRVRVINATARIAANGVKVAEGVADATFLIRGNGVAGKVALTSTAQPDAALFFAWMAGTTFDLEFNTTPSTITVPFGATTASIAAGPFAQITALGGVVAQNLTLTGTFGLRVSGTEVAVAGTNLQANLRAGAQTIFALGPITSAMVIRSTGFAAQLAMNLATPPDSTVLGFSFTAATGLRLEINTTNQQITSIGPTTLTNPLAAGRYAQMIVTGNLSAGGLTAIGTMTFRVEASSLSVTGSVSVNVGVGATAFLVLQGNADWVIGSNGIAGRITMNAGTNTSSTTINAAISGTFTLEMNTTRTAVTALGARTFNPGLADRLNPTDPSPNAWARVVIDGSVTFRIAAVDMFRVTGTVAVAFSSGTLQMRVTGTANGVTPQFASGVSLTGILNVETNGTWGLLEVAAGTSGTLQGTGFNLTGHIGLAVNTLTGSTAARNITRKILNLNQNGFPLVNETISLPGASALFTIAGRLQLKQTISATVSDAFGANGNFEVRVNGANFTMTGSSRVDVEFLGNLSGDFDVAIDTAGADAGMFGVIRLGAGANLSLAGARFDLDGFVSLEFNTVAAARTVAGARPAFSDLAVVTTSGVPTYNQSVTIAANTVRIFIAGSLQLEQGSTITDSFLLRGGLELTLQGANIQLRGAAKLLIPTMSGLYTSLDLQVTSAGIAATVLLGSAPGSTDITEINRTGLRLDARFRLEINTTNDNITNTVSRLLIDPDTGALITVNGVPQTEDVTIPERTVRLVATGSLVWRDGVGTGQTDSFFVVGQYELVVSADNLSVDAFGYINLNRLDLNSRLVVDTSFTVSSAGVVAAFNLGGSSRHVRSGDGYSFDARFRLEINTTSSAAEVSRPIVDQNTGSISGTDTIEIAARTISLAALGSLRLGNNDLFTTHGYFIMTFDSTGLEVAIDARLKFLDIQLNVDGAAGIYTNDNGIALAINMRAGTDSSPFLNKGYFSTNATTTLQVNTRDNNTTLGIAPNTVRVRVDGNFGADGFDFNGAFNFTASGTRWISTLNISVDVFGFVDVNVSGSVGFDTDRNTPNDSLVLDGSAGISVGDNINGASLTLSVHFSSSGDFSATASGVGRIAGVTAGAVTGTLNESGTLTLNFYALGVPLGQLRFSLSSSGAALLGPLAGATVFFDGNGNLVLDEGEPSAITDEFGAYTLPQGWVDDFDLNGNGQIDDNEGFLIATGGIDVTTGLPFVGILKSYATGFGQAVPLTLSPLSTVLTYLADDLGSREEANAALAGALELPLSPGLDFATFDPFAAALGGAENGSDFYVGSVQFSSLVAGINAYLSAAQPGVDAATMTSLIYENIAAEILGTPPGSPIDLASSSVVQRIIENTVADADISVPPTVATAAQVIASAAGEINAAGTGDIVTILSTKAAVQGPVADVLKGLGDGSIAPAEALLQATGDGFDQLLSNVTVPGVPEGYEMPDAQLSVETLPDGTQHVTVLAMRSETDVANQFELTVPLTMRGTLNVTQVTVEANNPAGGPAFLEVRSSFDDYQTVVARVATQTGLQSYVIDLDIPDVADPLTLRILGVESVVEDALIRYTNVTATALLTPSNQAPVAYDDEFMMDKNQTFTLDVPGLLANDVDPDGDTLRVVLVGSPTHGSLTLLENGSLVYTPEIGFNGTVEFTYRLQDNFGAFSNTATVRIIVNGSNDQVVVSLIADPWDSTKTALRVIGTDGADTIQFVQQGNQDRIKVLVNNVSYGEFTFTGHILAYGLGGNDLIDVTDNIENVAVLLGGEGNDELSGGAGSAILLGGGGNDVIEGAKSRSILIGGDGSDRLVGGREDDILIGDVVQDQFDLSSLVHALGLWNLSVTYTQRITLLGGPSKILDLTILADDDSDLLTGGSGKDWYFAGRVDKVSGQASDEVLTAV